MTRAIINKRQPEPTAQNGEKGGKIGFFKENASSLIYLFLTVTYVSMVLLSFKQTFWINDNLGILADIKSNCMVSFMSVLLGKFMSLLYLQVSDRIAWYGIILYVFASISFFLTLYAIDNICVNKWIKIGIISVFMICYSRFILNIGYNAVSINIGFSSLLALLVYRRISEKPKVLIVLCLGFCFSLSYLVRTRGYIAVIVFSFIILLYELFWKSSKKGWILILFFIPLIVAVGADKLYKNDAANERYRDFKAWNSYRGKFHGFPISRINNENKILLKKNNWSVNDYKMLSKWIYFDEKKFNIETMQNVFKFTLPLPQQQPLDFKNLFWRSIFLWQVYPPFTSMLILFFLMAFLILNKFRFFYFFAYLAHVSAGAVVMQTFYRFPPRIAGPIFLGVSLLCCYFVFFENRDANFRYRWDKKIIKKYLVLGFSLCFVAIGLSDLPRIHHRIEKNARYQKIYYDYRDYLEKLDADLLIIQPTTRLYSHYRDPLKVHHSQIHYIPTGWPIFSPQFYKKLDQVNLNHGYEVLPRTVDQKKDFIIGNSNFIESIVTFLSENQGIDCQYELVDKMNPKVGVYRIVTR